MTIRQKLTSISMLSSLTALVSASIAFLSYDSHSVRESMAGRVLTDAQIVAFNSVSPLLFNDAETATTTLGGLKAERAVVAAVIRRDKDGPPFASYARAGQAAGAVAAPASLERGHMFTPDHLFVSEPIEFEGRRIGMLLIQADLREIAERRRRYAAIVLAVLAGSLLVAALISRFVEQTLSRPILHLAETARAVSARKDYSVRARPSGKDELAQLTVTFNEMLDQIQRQNADLEEARGELEKRVLARTRDLAAANKELEAFSYSVSHDLRAPLRAIDGFSKVLLAHYNDKLDDRGRHYLERVRSGTLRMSALIDDLLGLARLSSRELQRQPVDLGAIACRVAAELTKRDPQRHVRLDVQDGLTTEADPHLLAIALENLIGNAWKFTGKREDAKVEVGKQDLDGQTAFHVRDNGAGFDMAYADKLFGAFQRLHDDSEFEGSGVGLATVQRVVARHGGRIWAEAEVDRGATFYFTLERKA